MWKSPFFLFLVSHLLLVVVVVVVDGCGSILSLVWDELLRL
jgi:hypothetical protein